MVFLGFGYTKNLKTRGDVIVNNVDVSDEFARDFSRVITKNRAEALPDITFAAPNGDLITWVAFQGEYLLVNFWATWCPPCVVELPSLNALQKRFDGRGLKVIAVSLDAQRTHDQIKKFLYNRNIDDFAGYWDIQGQITANIRMRGIPTTYLLGPDGNILHIFEGDADWNSPASIEFFRALLNQNNA